MIGRFSSPQNALDLTVPASDALLKNRKNAWVQLAGHPGRSAAVHRTQARAAAGSNVVNIEVSRHQTVSVSNFRTDYGTVAF